MFVMFPDIKLYHCVFFSCRHDCFGASSHINNAAARLHHQSDTLFRWWNEEQRVPFTQNCHYSMRVNHSYTVAVMQKHQAAIVCGRLAAMSQLQWCSVVCNQLISFSKTWMYITNWPSWICFRFRSNRQAVGWFQRSRPEERLHGSRWGLEHPASRSSVAVSGSNVHPVLSKVCLPSAPTGSTSPRKTSWRLCARWPIPKSWSPSWTTSLYRSSPAFDIRCRLSRLLLFISPEKRKTSSLCEASSWARRCALFILFPPLVPSISADDASSCAVNPNAQPDNILKEKKSQLGLFIFVITTISFQLSADLMDSLEYCSLCCNFTLFQVKFKKKKCWSLSQAEKVFSLQTRAMLEQTSSIHFNCGVAISKRFWRRNIFLLRMNQTLCPPSWFIGMFTLNTESAGRWMRLSTQGSCRHIAANWNQRH